MDTDRNGGPCTLIIERGNDVGGPLAEETRYETYVEAVKAATEVIGPYHAGCWPMRVRIYSLWNNFKKNEDGSYELVPVEVCSFEYNFHKVGTRLRYLLDIFDVKHEVAKGE